MDGVVPSPTGTIYGMAGQSASVNYGGPMGGHVSVWMGGHSEYEMSYEGHNGSQTFYGADAVNMLRGYSSIWHEGSVTAYSASAGDPSLNGETLYNVNLGYWEELANYGGHFTTLLQTKSEIDAYSKFNYGSKLFSAEELTFLNATRMGNIAKWSGRVGNVLTVVPVGIAAYNEGGVGKQTRIESLRASGALVGAIGGAQLGAEIGAAVGVWFGGVGAIPGTAIGAIIGGAIGGFAGGYYGGEAAVGTYNYIVN